MSARDESDPPVVRTGDVVRDGFPGGWRGHLRTLGAHGNDPDILQRMGEPDVFDGEFARRYGEGER